MSSKTNPLVSVVIPAYNAEKYLWETLESVFSQTYRPIEVIVVDDGSVDATVSVVERYRQIGPGAHSSSLVCVRQKNAGPSAARNRGIAASKGAYITFLDSDDLWPAGKLQSQVALMEEHKDAFLAFGDVQRFTEAKEGRGSMFLNKGLGREFFGGSCYVDMAFEKLLEVNFIPTGTVMLRAGFEKKAGMFDESFRMVEDLEFWYRIALHYRVAYSTEVWEFKRDHSSNVSNDSEAMQASYIRVLEKLEREFGAELKAKGISIDRCYATAYLRLGNICLEKNSMAAARSHLWKSMLRSPRLRTAACLLSSFRSAARAQLPGTGRAR